MCLLDYCLVWVVRRGRAVLVGEVGGRCEELIREGAASIGCEVCSLEVGADHVRLVLRCPPDLAPNQMAYRIKGYSARHLRREFEQLRRMPSMWTRDYLVATVGSVPARTIEGYVQKHSAIREG